MHLNWRFHNIKRNFILSYLVFSMCCLLSILLSPKTYATTINDYYSGNLGLQVQVCRRESGNDGYYLNCGTNRNVSIAASTTNNLDIAFTLTQRKDSNVSYDLNDRCTGYSDYCYVVIRRITYYPKINSSTSSSDSYPHLNDFFYARLMTTSFLELGSLRDYYSDAVNTNDNYYNTLFGLDSYINFNANGQYSCLDSTDYECDMRYYFNHDPTDLESGGLYNSFVVSAKVGVNNMSSLTFVENPYDQANSKYTRNPYDTLLYVIQVPNYNVNNNPTIFQAFIRFYTSDEFIVINDNAGVDPDNPDWNIIQGNLSDVDNALGTLDFDFSVINPFSNFFNAFTDNTCVQLPILSGWFNIPTQTICSPWPSSMRQPITSAFNFVLAGISFGFIIHWLQNRYGEGKEYS